MVDEPAAEHVAAVDEMAGVAGVVSCAALLNELDARETQLPLLAVTV
jgi:hypothetical protein